MTTQLASDVEENILQVAVIDAAAPDVLTQFAAAMRKIGFAVLKNHSVDTQLISKAYQAWFDFFQAEDKYHFTFDEQTHDGYVSTELAETAKGASVKDLKEFYHYFRHGRCPSYLKPLTDALFTQLEHLACTLLGGLEQGLPTAIRNTLDRPMSQMVNQCEHSLLRPIHYPPLTGAEPAGAIRAAAHEDICLLTLIPRATAPGLQVLTKDKRWLDVPCGPDYIIVNAGDCLQECTAGYYPSTTHRVINPTQVKAGESKARLSMPLFLHPHSDVVLSKRHTAASYRRERFIELGLLSADAPEVT